MSAILLALSVTALLLAALILLPVAVALSLSRPTAAGPLHFEARLGLFLGWFGGGVQVGPQGAQTFVALGGWKRLLGAAQPTEETSPQPAAEPAAESTAESDSKPAPKPTTRRSAWDRLVRLWHLAGAPTALLARRLPRAIAWRRCSLVGKLGFTDPALTGRIYGLLAALEAMAPKRLDMRLQPDFIDGSRGSCSLHLHLYPSRLLLLFGLFAFRLGSRWLGMRWRRLASSAALLLFSCVCHTATASL